MKTKSEIVDGYMTRHTPEGQAIRAELENIWENGYIHGRRDFGAFDVTEELHRQYNKGYANGHDAGKDEAYKELSGWTAEEGKEKIDEAYDKGADDARYELWWAIKKLYLDPSNGGFSMHENPRIFGKYTVFQDILRDYTPEEVIEKVKSYEESKNPAPTNRDKFEALFNEQFPRLWHSYQIAKNGYTSDNGFFIPDSWLDKPYEEPADGN